MFIVENWGGGAALAKHVCNFSKKFVAWIQGLPLLVAGVLPVLADQQDAIHRQFATSPSQGFSNRGIDFHVGKELTSAPTQIPLGELVHVQRDHVHGRQVVFPVPTVTPQKAVHDVLGRGSSAGIPGSRRQS